MVNVKPRQNGGQDRVVPGSGYGHHLRTIVQVDTADSMFLVIVRTWPRPMAGLSPAQLTRRLADRVKTATRLLRSLTGTCLRDQLGHAPSFAASPPSTHARPLRGSRSNTVPLQTDERVAALAGTRHGLELP